MLIATESTEGIVPCFKTSLCGSSTFGFDDNGKLDEYCCEEVVEEIAAGKIVEVPDTVLFFVFLMTPRLSERVCSKPVENH